LAQPNPQNAQAQSAAGQVLGGFEIITKLGQGGMGAVFLARQVSMDRQVALKVLPQRLGRSKEFVERFLREARAAAQLSHVNIVQAIDAGHASGYYYFAMEYVAGRDLRQILDREGALPEKQALEFTRQLAGALDYAHTAAHVIHRDIKPENVLVTAAGVPKLTDLGLAREVTRGDQSLTKTGVAMGTPNYISPEQVRGETDLDGRTDVYSLGATLYHLLTGQPPYTGGTSAEVMAKHLSDPVPDARAVNPRVSAAAAAIVRKAMMKDRRQRYPSARDMANDIERALGGASPAAVAAVAAAPTVKMRARTGSIVRRRRARVRSAWPYVGGIAAVAALAVLVWLAVLSRSGPQRPEPPHNPAVSRHPAAVAPDPNKTNPPNEVVTDPEDPSPGKPEDPAAVEADRRKRADAEFARMKEEAKARADAEDFDGAIAVFAGISPEFRDLLSDRAKGEVTALDTQAEKRIIPVLESAQRLETEKKYDDGLAKLDELDDVKYKSLDARKEELRKRLADVIAKRDAEAKQSALAQAKTETLKTLIAANIKLYETYIKKCDELKNAESAALKGEYAPQYLKVNKDIEDLSNKISDINRQLRNLRSGGGGDRGKGRWGRWFKPIRRRDGGSAEERRDLERQRSALSKQKIARLKDKLRIELTVKSQRKQISARDQKRRSQVVATYKAHAATLKSGTELTQEKMVANYEAAVQVK